MVFTGLMVISSLGFSDVVQRSIQLGAEDFFLKPVDVDLLRSRVLQYFEGQLSDE
jgi:response regulator of citrate/malate metabolism